MRVLFMKELSQWSLLVGYRIGTFRIILTSWRRRYFTITLAYIRYSTNKYVNKHEKHLAPSLTRSSLVSAGLKITLNTLGKIPAHLFALQELRDLEIDGKPESNQVLDLENIGRMTHLQRLVVDGMRMVGDRFSGIPAAFGKLTELRVLVLKKAGLDRLAKVLFTLNKLEVGWRNAWIS